MTTVFLWKFILTEEWRIVTKWAAESDELPFVEIYAGTENEAYRKIIALKIRGIDKREHLRLQSIQEEIIDDEIIDEDPEDLVIDPKSEK